MAYNYSMEDEFVEKIIHLVKSYRNLIFRELIRESQFGSYYPTEEIMEDIQQESIMEAWKRKKEYDSHQSALSTWVGWIVRGKAYDWKKYHSRRSGIEVDTELSENSTPEETLEVEQCFGCLTDKENFLLGLKVGNVPYAEMASIHDTSEENIRKQISNIKKKLDGQ